MAKIVDLRGKTMGGASKRSVSQIRKIARHHSATTSGDYNAFANHWRTLRWRTGGYHEIILRDGSVQLCYDANVITNGISGHNTETYHICVVGNGSFTAAQEKAFRERALYNAKRFGLTVADILGHNEFSGHSSNSCPGIDMRKVRAELSAPIVENKPKEDDDKLKLHNWQWEMIIENLERMYDDKIISDKNWIDKAKRKQLTISELAFLNNVIITRREAK